MDEKVKIQDIINDKPKNIFVMKRDLVPLYKEFHKIIKGLKDGKQMLYKTAKEIHELYKIIPEEGEKNKSDKEYHKSLKSIYRYLERLKEGELIIEGGKRITEGSRIIENLYCSAAELYFIEDAPIEDRWWNNPESNFSCQLNALLANYYGVSKFPENIFKEFTQSFFSIQDDIVDNIAKSAETNEDVMTVYRNIEMGEINFINSSVATFAILMDNPDILKPLKEYLDSQKK